MNEYRLRMKFNAKDAFNQMTWISVDFVMLTILTDDVEEKIYDVGMIHTCTSFSLQRTAYAR